MNANVVEFYRKARVDQGLIEALSEGKTAEEFVNIAVTKAAEMGLHFEKNDVIDAFDQFETFVAAAANDDELTEFELQYIAAGTVPTCANVST